MKKYGMAYHTICYFQEQGNDYAKYRGSYPLQCSAMSLIRNIDKMSARDIAHRAIEIASCRAEYLVRL